MAIKRSKNLGSTDIAVIVEMLDGWKGKLTWDLLIDAVAARLHNRYTRQTLHKHERIRLAFETRKAAPDGVSRRRGAASPASPELQAALERIERLENQSTRLEQENQRLLEQFVRWAYNAHVRGLDLVYLSQPLPTVNRGQTRPM